MMLLWPLHPHSRTEFKAVFPLPTLAKGTVKISAKEAVTIFILATDWLNRYLQFPRITIVTTTAAMMTPATPNKSDCLLQYLQTSDGHHGILAMKRKPMLVNHRTEQRSLSGFSFLQ